MDTAIFSPSSLFHGGGDDENGENASTAGSTVFLAFARLLTVRRRHLTVFPSCKNRGGGEWKRADELCGASAWISWNGGSLFFFYFFVVCLIVVIVKVVLFVGTDCSRVLFSSRQCESAVAWYFCVCGVVGGE